MPLYKLINSYIFFPEYLCQYPKRSCRQTDLISKNSIADTISAGEATEIYPARIAAPPEPRKEKTDPQSGPRTGPHRQHNPLFYCQKYPTSMAVPGSILDTFPCHRQPARIKSGSTDHSHLSQQTPSRKPPLKSVKTKACLPRNAYLFTFW